MGVKNIFGFIFIVAMSLLAIFSSYTDSVYKLRIQNQHSNLIISSPDQIVVRKSIDSAVRVVSTLEHTSGEGVTSTSSGTYLKYNNKNYVITSAHSLIGECYRTMIIADDYMFECKEFTVMNTVKDIAIIEVQNIFNRKLIKITDILYSETEAKRQTGIHEKTFYTGYPQAMGPFTFDGKIVSHYIENDMFFVNSYAWAGSSGSGIFNSNGRLIGVITAVSIANTEHGIDVMEDLVIVTSLTTQDFQGALK